LDGQLPAYAKLRKCYEITLPRGSILIYPGVDG
jgi:hypothetical protein